MAIPHHHPDISARIYDGEAVIISPATNRVVMLNPVGSRIWELIDGEASPDDIAVALTAEFEVELQHARQSVQAFLDQLTAKQLIDWR